MRKGGKKRIKCLSTEPKRQNKMVCLMNEEELQIVNRYLDKHKITNKSRWMRETMLTFIYGKMMGEDYPTLFDEHDMRR